MGFPGLGQEVKEHCRELGLPDATTEEIEKEEVKEAIQLSKERVKKWRKVCPSVLFSALEVGGRGGGRSEVTLLR